MARKSAARTKGTFDFSMMKELPKPKPEESWVEMRDNAIRRREELIELVRKRELKWDEAELRASKEKLGPLASRLGM